MRKLAVCTGILVAFCLVLASVSLEIPGPWIRPVFCAPDSQGNDINYCEVWQWNTTHWNLVVNFTSSGGSSRIHDSWYTKFIISMKFNSSLASSQQESKDYTKVLMNITKPGPTYIWTNVELNNTSCSGPTSNNYWLIEEGNWTSTLPEAGVTYTVSIDYQSYW